MKIITVLLLLSGCTIETCKFKTSFVEEKYGFYENQEPTPPGGFPEFFAQGILSCDYHFLIDYYQE